MDHLARHVGDLLTKAIKAESVSELFKFIDDAEDVSFAGRGTHGTTHFVRRGTKRVAIKIVVQFPPDTDPINWWSEEDNPSMSEALLGTYYYTGQWKNGWNGEPIPRVEDRVGNQLEPKSDDPLPHLVDYTGFVILEQREVGTYYEKMAEASARSGAPQAEIEDLETDALNATKAVDDGLLQRLYVMTLEAGDSGTLDGLARTDPEFPLYAVDALVQLLCTLYLLRSEDGFVHGDASTANIVRKMMPGAGRASMRYRVQNDADGAIYLKVERDGDYPLFMFIDFGLARFDDRKIVSIDEMRERAQNAGRVAEARLLSWVSEWHEPKASVAADLHLSHAADKHLMGSDLLKAFAYRLYDKVDSDPAAVDKIWAIANFAVDRLLIPPDAIKSGMHPVPAYPMDAMRMDYEAIYGAFFSLVDRAVQSKDQGLLLSIVSYRVRDYTVGGESMDKYTNAPDNLVSTAVRFFPPSAVANWDEFRSFWTDPIFDAVRTIEPKRGLKRGFVSLAPGVSLGEGSESMSVTRLINELPPDRPVARPGKRITLAHAGAWKGLEDDGRGISLL